MTTELLIDEINTLEKNIEHATKLLKEKKNTLVNTLINTGRDKAYGLEGLGFQLAKTATQYKYSQDAYEYLEQKNVLQFFVGDPKITRKGLEDLRKEGLLDYGDLNVLEHYTTPVDGEYTIRKIVDKEYQKELLDVEAVRLIA